MTYEEFKNKIQNEFGVSIKYWERNNIEDFTPTFTLEFPSSVTTKRIGKLLQSTEVLQDILKRSFLKAKFNGKVSSVKEPFVVIVKTDPLIVEFTGVGWIVYYFLLILHERVNLD